MRLFLSLLAVLVVAAVTYAILPGKLRDHANGRHIAFTLPAGETPAATGDGLLFTTSDGRVTGRDLKSGRRLWSKRAGARASVQVVGSTVLVSAGGSVRALLARSGEERWNAAGHQALPVVASPDTVAVSRCDGDDCRVEALDLASGRARWSAPVYDDAQTLGAPTGRTRYEGPYAVGVPQPLWPSHHVVVFRDRHAYAVRDLRSGRTVLRGRSDKRMPLVLVGDRLLRARTTLGDDTTIEGIDLATGARSWRKRFHGALVLAYNGIEPTVLAISNGSAVLTGTFHFDGGPYEVTPRQRSLDPRTGELTQTPNDVGGQFFELPAIPPPPVTEASARDLTAAGEPVRVPLTPAYAPTRDLAVTPQQIATTSDAGAAVRDRRTLEVSYRYKGDDIAVRAVGDRIAIKDGAAWRIASRAAASR